MHKVALIGGGMCSWDGGLDFLINIAKAIHMDKTFSCILVLPKYSSKIRLLRKIFHKDVKKEKARIDKAVKIFSERCPWITIKFYNKIPEKLESYKGANLDRFLLTENIDIAFPILDNAYPKMKTPWVGYIPDLQECYFPEFFSEKEIANRHKRRKFQLNNSKYILVTSHAVKKDICKFFPDEKSKLFVMPFAPVAAEEYMSKPDISLDLYQLPDKYFIISNQFWMHKSHITAFKALKELHTLPLYQDVHIVCTGKMSDYRNTEYCRNLLKEVNQMHMDDFIHFLGYISKCDQIEIMKRSRALIQPTLFEGDPGGCSTYDAASMGIPCILSDIAVNKEAMGTDGITFFKVKDSKSLKNEMVKILEKEREKITPSSIKGRIEKNSSVLCEFYQSMLMEVINGY